MPDTRSQQRRDLAAIFALGLVFRLALLIVFPVPYGNDAAGRLYFRETLLTWHWLPVTQALVYVPFAVTHSIEFVRIHFAIVGSLAGVACAYFMQTFASRRAALIGGILFTLNAHAIFLSLMPYQEVVFLGLLFGALAFFARNEAEHRSRYCYVIGSGLYGLACLTRYEAWFILPAIFLSGLVPTFRTRDIGGIARTALRHLAALAWGPALWAAVNWIQWGSPTAFLFHRADQSFYAWNPHAETERLAIYAGNMLYWMLRFGSPLIFFALPGLWLCWKSRATVASALWPPLLLTVLELGFLMFVAGGEFATANRFAMIPIAVLLIFTGIGINDVVRRLQGSSQPVAQFLFRRGPRTAVVCATFVFLLVYGAAPVASANRLPEYRLPFEVAEFLDDRLQPHERAILVASSLEGEVPMPYQRVFGQLAFSKEQLTCSWFIAVDTIQTLLANPDVRYIILWLDENGGERERFQEAIGGSRVAFANDAAVIYDRAPDLTRILEDRSTPYATAAR